MYACVYIYIYIRKAEANKRPSFFLGQTCCARFLAWVHAVA